jgi:NTP pyrophosphatase (non-canonical NTP hydrolase)|tara:strand:- start:61 stop:384 length:324 start_codon:yes stop_codon:yes gene_type:complete
MEFNEYQEFALKTAIYPKSQGLIYTTLGLVGESGEVAEKVKKLIREDNIQDEDWSKSVARELGDVLWYVANLATELGIDLDTIAKMNLIKLEDRLNRDVLNGNGDYR